jgi:hypothetical protein
MKKIKIESIGKCLFCGRSFAKSGINRHMKTHLEEKSSTNKPGSSFLIQIEPDKYYGGWPYFLSLWIDGEIPMLMIDDFLRAIWLECCGHMSAFRNPEARKNRVGIMNFFEAEELILAGKIKQYEKLMEETSGEIPMSRKAKDVFNKIVTLEYEYDFGSSTNLQIRVIGSFSFKADKPVVLLSRNEPLEIYCNMCKEEPATVVCVIHNWDDDTLFCETCAKKHAMQCPDFKDYSAMPVVNSPRYGVCGYTGGSIDLERDGCFQHKK